MDILMSESGEDKEELFYLIDVNYFSSYNGIENMDLKQTMRELFREKIEGKLK
jgi:hypothetical protein